MGFVQRSQKRDEIHLPGLAHSCGHLDEGLAAGQGFALVVLHPFERDDGFDAQVVEFHFHSPLLDFGTATGGILLDILLLNTEGQRN